MNFNNVLNHELETGTPETFDALLRLERLHNFMLRTSVNTFSIRCAISENERNKILSYRKYFGRQISKAVYEGEALQESTFAELCDILDMYLKIQPPKEV